MPIVHRVILLLVLLAMVSAEGRAATNPEHSLFAGVLALQQRSFRMALQHCRNAATQAPTNFAAHSCRGQAAEILGEFDEALEAYQTTAQIRPSPAHDYQIALLASRMGNQQLAKEKFTETLSSWPTEIPDPLKSLFSPEVAAQDLFYLFIEADDRKAALELARSRRWVQEGVNYCDPPSSMPITAETSALLAMLLQPQRADCLLSVGMNLTEGGLVNLARVALVDRIQHSSDPEVRKKAEVFVRHRLPAQDVKKQAESLNIIGYNFQHSVKQPQEALAVYHKAIAADPSFPWPYHNIGQVYRKEGNNTQAIEWYQKAIALNPNYWKAHVNLGVSLAALRRDDEAFAAYQKAVALNPDDSDSRQWLSSHQPPKDKVIPTAFSSSSSAPPTESLWSYSWWNAVVPLLACAGLLLLARVRLGGLSAEALSILRDASEPPLWIPAPITSEKPTRSARLVQQNPIEGVPSEIVLNRDATLIGQGKECDAIIPHVSLSRQHVRIEKRKQGYVLFDLQSQTGSYVNGRRVVENLLKEGMKVRIGEVEFVFYGVGQQE